MTTHIEARDALVKRLRSVSDEGFRFDEGSRFAGEAADELARTCEWSRASETGAYFLHWNTSCKDWHEFRDDGIPTTDYGLRFCPYCGGRISVKEA